MLDTLASEPAPLVLGADDVVRIRGTRVTLETVLAAYSEGATAEEIAQQYPSLSLADAYQTIGYYLRHTTELESYLAGRREKAGATRELNEARWPASGIRDRLLARRK